MTAGRGTAVRESLLMESLPDAKSGAVPCRTTSEAPGERPGKPGKRQKASACSELYRGVGRTVKTAERSPRGEFVVHDRVFSNSRAAECSARPVRQAARPRPGQDPAGCGDLA